MYSEAWTSRYLSEIPQGLVHVYACRFFFCHAWKIIICGILTTCCLFHLSTVAGEYRCNAYLGRDTFFGLPGFPNPVDSSTPRDCEWRIITPLSSRNYQLRITYLDLPASANCSTHSLTVYNGLFGISTKQKAKLCGQICEEQVIPLDEQFTYVKLHLDSLTVGSFTGVQAIMEEVTLR